MAMDLARLALLGVGGAAVGIGLKIPSGALVGAMVAVGAGSLIGGWNLRMPDPVFTVGLTLIGAHIGGQMTRDTVGIIWASIIPALSVVLLLIGLGLGVAFVLSFLGVMDLRDALFSASPGAMSAVVGMSASAGANAALVASFHVLRIVLVTVSLPVLLAIATR